MNTENKQKWIDALESGEYAQTREKLRDNEGYCCLGVLCDIWSKESNRGSWGENDLQGDFLVDGKVKGYIPKEVKEWLGIEITNTDPFCVYRGTIEETSLIDMNDSGRKNFKEIATAIKEGM